MKTLIELYDERPLENVLAAEVFRPERTVYICPAFVARSPDTQDRLRNYLHHRGVFCELVFLEAAMFSAESVAAQLSCALSRYEDCALDITGGTDAALFAAGQVAASSELPVFTYSRRKNSFFSIRGADFADALACDVQHKVEDCFLMAGGVMRSGRVDNSVLDRYLDLIDPFFALYLAHRQSWVKIVNYFQRVSQPAHDGSVSLSVRGDYSVKGERGSVISADEDALRDLERIGFISSLSIERGRRVSFTFRDAQVRAWLRDVGSVLELYVYKACLDTGLFQDVITSAVVDWESDGAPRVTNELDVMACCGVTPLFISCKTCDVKTEALNELSILRSRFGGGIAKAAIVTAENGSAGMKKRAAELDIRVIGLSDLRSGALRSEIEALMK